MRNVRRWSEESDDGSVHCLGNGQMCVYEQGPNVIQAFGPPYSTASVLRLNVSRGQGLRSESSRELGTAIWTHAIFRADVPAGKLADFVDAELPCFVREARLEAPLVLTFETDPDVECVVEPAEPAGGGVIRSLRLTVAAGRYLYPKYPMPYPVSYRLFLSGEASLQAVPDSTRWEIRLQPGVSWVYLVGGPLMPQTEQHAEAVRAVAPAELQNRTRAWWAAFRGRRLDFAARIPPSIPEREEILDAIDDVAVIIKTQEARGGGILAGYPYHLLYVRDQYGVSRCLLRLGYFEEAKNILQRDWMIWQRHGCIHNAQAAGVDGVFHIHENDEVEITGYLLIQAFDYARAANDWAFLAEIRPMLEWAWSAPQRHLAHDMLPFNGDETYVAGGILPRSTLNDGSAEATLLFITGGTRFLEWVERESVWAPERLVREQAVLERVRAAYTGHFLLDGRYVTNNPARKTGATLPRFRHGVCEACSAFGWTEKNAHDRYVCVKCSVAKPLPGVPPKVYCLQSVALLPLYIGASLPGREEVAHIAEHIVEQFKTTGSLPSRPDGNAAVGYDFGLLLYTLAALGHPAAGPVYERMMSVRDATGAWVEYYEAFQPRSTRYRPWESGISLDAALAYLAHRYGLAI